MDWRRRLREIGRAGGLVTVAVTMSGCAGGCCNANPDPCCSAPKSAECETEKECLADGGQADYYKDDGGFLRYGCAFPRDLGVPDLAAPADLSRPRDVASGD
jgi:hypothetical protein